MSSVRVVQTATTRILRHRFPGASKTVGQVFKFVWRLHWKINAVCISLSPIVSFKSRFVTYSLNFPRIILFIPVASSFFCHIRHTNTFLQVSIYSVLRRGCTRYHNSDLRSDMSCRKNRNSDRVVSRRRSRRVAADVNEWYASHTIQQTRNTPATWRRVGSCPSIRRHVTKDHNLNTHQPEILSFVPQLLHL